MAAKLEMIRNGTSRQEKGKAFENLIAEIFGQISGLELDSIDSIDEYESEEIDIFFWNKKPSDGAFFLPELFPIECKAWKDPADANVITRFEAKIGNTGGNAGILVALHGITGQNDHPPLHANHEIYMARSRKCRILVLSEDDIRGVSSTENLLSILRARMGNLARTGNQFVAN